MKSLIGFLLLITMALLLFVGCSAATEPPNVETLKDLGFRPIPSGNPFPDISFSEIGNQQLNLSDFRDSVVLLNFWASWCPPCRAEMPAMERLADELSGGNFEMIPINVQEPVDLVKSFVKEFEIGFTVYMDPDAEAARAVGVSGLPTSILIDRDGTAVAAVTGAIEWDSEEMVSMMKKWVR